MTVSASWSRWFAPLVALLMVVSLTGCFDKEGEQRKAFSDFLQNTAMRSGERLPTLTSDQKKQFGPFVSDYAILYGFSQQMNQAIEQGINPIIDTVNSIRTPQDYLTQRDTLRQEDGALNVLRQQIQSAKMQADNAYSTLKQSDELKTAYDNVFKKVVTTPSNIMDALIPAAQNLTGQLVQVGDFIAQQNDQVGFESNGIQFPKAQQATEYNNLIAPIASQHQAFMQAYTKMQNAMQ